jgi:hypothetical protein
LRPTWRASSYEARGSPSGAEVGMELVYRLIVLFFAIHIGWYVFKERSVWNQAGGVLLLVLFVLRLLMVK